MKILSTMRTVRTYIIIVVAMISACSAVWSWYHPRVETVMVEKEVPKYVERIKRVEVPVEKIVVREKKVIVREANLPQSVSENPNKQIAEVAECNAHDGKTTVASIVDTKTGKTSIFMRQERPVFLSTEPLLRNKELGLRYGIGTHGTGYDVFGRWIFFRIGAVHLAGYGEINNYQASEPQWYAGVEVSWRF